MLHDDANPAQKVTTQFDIPVIRNEYGPRFTSEVYPEDVSENYPLGVSIMEVTASDRDEVR